MKWMFLPLKRIGDFRGRSRRREFWMFTLFEVAVICATGFVDRSLGATSDEGIIGPLVVLAFMVPSVMVSIRRLHDTDRSGWWIWVSLVPVLGSLALLALFCMEGTGGTNRYGEDPKDADISNDVFA